MQQYFELAKTILSRGEHQFDPRTEENILGIDSHVYSFDLREGFPLMTTKEVNPRQPFEEVFWKLRGERNVKSLVDRRVHFWTANAFDRHLKNQGLKDKIKKHTLEWDSAFKEYKAKIKDDPEFAKTAGDLGPVYGAQWRHWTRPDGKEVDHLANLLNNIKAKPGSRYHILNSYNSGEIQDMAIGPCPFWHQFTVYGNNLDLTAVQRSCDTFLGVPFNDAQDGLLLQMVAKETGLTARFFHHHSINTHFYLGVSPRSDFWADPSNVAEFQSRVRSIDSDSLSQDKKRHAYLGLREWYLANTSPERQGAERKDHIPFILEQLSYSPQALPRLELKYDEPLMQVINRDVTDVIEVHGHHPYQWDSKAAMAA